MLACQPGCAYHALPLSMLPPADPAGPAATLPPPFHLRATQPSAWVQVRSLLLPASLVLLAASLAASAGVAIAAHLGGSASSVRHALAPSRRSLPQLSDASSSGVGVLLTECTNISVSEDPGPASDFTYLAAAPCWLLVCAVAGLLHFFMP